MPSLPPGLTPSPATTQLVEYLVGSDTCKSSDTGKVGGDVGQVVDSAVVEPGGPERICVFAGLKPKNEMVKKKNGKTAWI